MNTRDDLIRAVCRDPADDTVRLAFADFLDESGASEDRDRAAFIRVQIEIARREAAGQMECWYNDPDCPPVRGKPRVRINGGYMAWGKWRPNCRCAACSLRRKERKVSCRYTGWDWRREIPVNAFVLWRRGFVDSIFLPLVSFMDGNSRPTVPPSSPREMFELHPITNVFLNDRSPATHTVVFWFFVDISWRDIRWGARRSDHFRDFRYHLPPDLFPFMKSDSNSQETKSKLKGRVYSIQFNSTQNAERALSRGAANYGRSLAGLDQLPP